MKVLVDNGHGADTPGKRSPDGRLKEYAYAREIASRVVNALAKNGVDASLLVEEENDIPLAERVRRANMYNAKGTVLVSIHVNAAGSGSQWMAAKGWCIIFEHVAWIDVVTSVIYSVLFSLPILLLDNISTNVFVLFALFIIGFFGYFTYYNELISNIEEANSVVAAHLLIISQDGIDPETTPIYKKFQIFKTITDAVVWYFTIMMFRTILFELLNIPDFIMTIIYDIATIALLITTAYAFKLKKSLRNGYIMVGENTDSVEFTLDDIERLNEDNEIQRNATTPWHEGMPLPSQPRINRHFQANIPCVDSSSNKENSETNENLESHA